MKKIFIRIYQKTKQYLISLQENNFQYIITAHHANDQAETILFHLAKGTGLKGLVGMDWRNGKILRPLLNTSVLEIYNYIDQHKVPFREDISNESDKYSRNFIRHNIIPLMEKLNPNFIATMSGFSQRMQENYDLAKAASLQLWKKQATEKEFIENIDYSKSKELILEMKIKIQTELENTGREKNITSLLEVLDYGHLKVFLSMFKL